MDLCARYGGEEFVAVLSGAHVDAGVTFAERVRTSLQGEVALATLEGDGIAPFTVSAGVAAFVSGMEEPAELMAAADRALYRAKSDGRDRVRAEVPAATELA
jgi:two-component system, cell cycle response regulator